MAENLRRRLDCLERSADCGQCPECGGKAGLLVRVKHPDGSDEWSGPAPCLACGSPAATAVEIYRPVEEP